MGANAYEKRDLLQRSATEAEVKASLVMDQKWVPYPAYSDRNGWNNLLGDYRDDIIKTGEKCLDYKWEVVKASQYLEFEKSGSRDIMEKPNNRNSTAFGKLLMAELAEGKGRFLTDIMDGVFYFCEQTTWAESAHLVRFQKSGRAIPDYRTDVLELKQGGLAQMLSWTYYFLHDQLDKIDPIISMRLRHELQKRELDPFINRTDFWWMAWKESPTVFVNNWNPWCNANALLCYMLLENDRDKLTKAVYKSMISVDRYLNYVKADGACEEGATYWGHAFGKLFDYLSELQMITGGKVSLFNNKLVKDMGEFVAKSYIGNGYAVNFADASAHVSNYMALVYRCGKALGSREMMDMAVDCFKEKPESVPSVWLDTYTSGVPSEANTSSSSLHSPSADTMCTSRTVPSRSTIALCQSSMGESFSITNCDFCIRRDRSWHTSGVQSAISTVLAPCSSRRAGSRNIMVCGSICSSIASASAHFTWAFRMPRRGRLAPTTAQSEALRSTYVAQSKQREVNEKSTPNPPVRSVMLVRDAFGMRSAHRRATCCL